MYTFDRLGGFGLNRIKEMRTARGWTQQDLADKLNTKYQTIGHYETGRREPDIDTIFRLCDIFGCSADYLLGRSDLPDPQLTADEADLVQRYRALSETGREFIRHSVALASLGHSEAGGAFSDLDAAEVNGGKS